MPSPYTILGVSELADDATIRARYLTLVKENPPEREPKKFSEIRAAYEMIKDLNSRMNLWLTQPPNPNEVEEIIDELIHSQERTRNSLPQLLQIIKPKQ